MELATPVTVLFLDKNNPELTRNITSYLSLAVINHAHLVTAHVDCILHSIANGKSRFVVGLHACTVYICINLKLKHNGVILELSTS